MDKDAVLKTIRQFKKALESINIIVEQLILFGSHAANTAREYSDFEKVQKYWKEEIKKTVGLISRRSDEMSKYRLQKRLDFMRSVEMAVIVSEEAGEEERFQKQGIDIKFHRNKMNQIDANGHDIEYRFKDPNDKLQLVFVCAMWLTGFDAPTVSTLYLDKPMKDHTLFHYDGSIVLAAQFHAILLLF